MASPVIRIPADIYVAMKLRAEQEDRSLAAIMRRAFRFYEQEVEPTTEEDEAA